MRKFKVALVEKPHGEALILNEDGVVHTQPLTPPPHCTSFSYHLTVAPRDTLTQLFAYRNDCAVLCLVTQSWLTLCDPMEHSPPGSSVYGESPGKNTGVGCHALLQGNFQIQGLNPVSHIAGKFFPI